MELKIKVTKEILLASAGCSNDDDSVYSNCAIALAVRDIFPKALTFSTRIVPFPKNDCVDISMNTDTSIKLPKEAVSFIGTFDKLNYGERIKMTPIEFSIELPDEVIEQIDIEEVKAILKNHPTLSLA